jgi:hypothetical protein
MSEETFVSVEVLSSSPTVSVETAYPSPAISVEQVSQSPIVSVESDTRVVEITVMREVVSGPRGLQGIQGPAGDSVAVDPGDLTLLFENRLV